MISISFFSFFYDYPLYKDHLIHYYLGNVKYPVLFFLEDKLYLRKNFAFLLQILPCFCKAFVQVFLCFFNGSTRGCQIASLYFSLCLTPIAAIFCFLNCNQHLHVYYVLLFQNYYVCPQSCVVVDKIIIVRLYSSSLRSGSGGTLFSVRSIEPPVHVWTCSSRCASSDCSNLVYAIFNLLSVLSQSIS